MSSAFSSISSSVVSSKKYDVFLSFRGEDTRRNFTSHLYDALSRKKVATFIDNNELEKGDEISPALIKAIEESHASIIIFSENYATSKWCLNELKKILECKKYKEQIVIPVFYNIDPSHVRKQTGSYKQAFAKHKQDLKHNIGTLQKWKDALTEAANLVGWDSENYRNESIFIKEIVKDVLRKLNLRYQYEIKGLVGIEKNFEQIESILKIGSNDVSVLGKRRMVGSGMKSFAKAINTIVMIKERLSLLNEMDESNIYGLNVVHNKFFPTLSEDGSNESRVLGIWGMGGIGKTTLAKALYAKHYSQFEGRCFLNVKDESNKYGLNVVHNKFISTLLEEDNLRSDAPYLEAPFSARRIARKKVFIVLDNVETVEQIEDLILEIHRLGPGSRVIITTRDKQILSRFSKCEIYEVKELSKHDSLQLFSLTVFGEKHPKIGYEDLSESVIAYCHGNPLALKVLGANLSLRGKEAWESELKKLQKIPKREIFSVLKLSYDDLDCFQKAIFLDIACLLRKAYKDFVISLLEACEFFAIIGIEVLLNKALIQLKPIWFAGSETDSIEMHDLLQEMGRDIVNQESIDPGKRSRLWKAEEISDVLKKNKGTEAVEVITFDTTEVEDLYLKSDSFRKMTNLRYLKIYNASDGSTCNVYFPDGLEWLSDKLRYLCWEGYCLEYLPSTFCAEMLVALDMRNSKLKKLWDGVQNLVNLISIEFSFSKDLIEIPDLSRATNLQYIYLHECESLCQLHPSILSLPRLGELDLGGCIKLQSLKTNIHSTSLRKLFLTVCSSLTEFSVTSEEMTHLYLCGTAIHELSSSIWRNSKLVFLDLSECNKLNIVGNKLSNDHGLGSVTELDLSGCTEIDALSLRFILDGVQSLNRLKLKRCCNLECLPDNIQNHSMLKCLELDDCKKLVSLTELPPSVLNLSAVNCTYLDTDFTQQSIIENMIQAGFKDVIEGFSFLPGAQVPCMFDFQKMEASITMSPIPKSDLHAFIFCIILSEGFNLNNYDLHCIIFEHDKEVDRCRIIHNYHGTLISDHALIGWYVCNKQESGSYDFCNLSFRFIVQENEEKLRWSTEWIKGCGVSPLYICERELEMDGGSKIVDLKLKSKAQDFAESDWHLKKDIDELQTRSIEGEARSSNNEYDQEQPSYSRKEEEQLSFSRPPIKHVYIKRRRTK
ncbi:unnamed protein product [Trifolium pratense]|uniref:Uncharacterized protein n=1 Tax=Trifolium pratense TaxID=57577 RepID=A0ACB0J772_TRIPR|nr:unnamed protein product [Trifolium pratense]